MKPDISIIIPTLNEEAYLGETISNLLMNAENPDSLELIVVDAGSSDKTLESVENYEVRTFLKPDFVLKKYQSLNFGIEQSTGEYLIFLDADTMLPENFDELVIETLKNPEVSGGAFEFSFENPDWKLWLIQQVNRLRYRKGKMFFGDQAIFCRKSSAVNVGGFPKKQLMESAYFCRELKKEGTLKLITRPIKTSARRFKQHGFFKVSWFDLMMWVRFNLNLPVEEYGKKYWGINLKSNG